MRISCHSNHCVCLYAVCLFPTNFFSNRKELIRVADCRTVWRYACNMPMLLSCLVGCGQHHATPCNVTFSGPLRIKQLLYWSERQLFQGQWPVVAHYLQVYALELLITAKQAGQSSPQADNMMPLGHTLVWICPGSMRMLKISIRSHSKWFLPKCQECSHTCQ